MEKKDEVFYLCRYDGQFVRWHSYKSSAARDKWAAIYRQRGNQVQYNSSFFPTKGSVMEPTALVIYLKGGNVLRLKVTDWKLKRGNVYGDLTSFSWTTANGEDTLKYIRLEEVQAVVKEV